jgi:hypothetical protein
LILLLLATTVACAGATPEVLPTDTPAATPTHTAKPTFTPRPTKTPNVAATEQYTEFEALIAEFAELGYIGTTQGTIREFDPFSESWAQINWYIWWPVTRTTGDFVFKGHVEWTSAAENPEDSGCGVVFGAQENEDHYSVFLTNNRILFLMARGTYAYEVGKTSGSGRTDFENPAAADFAVAVREKKSFVLVNGEVTEYTLSADQTTNGEFALSLLSGTNRDYGTRCEMSEMMMWRAE